MDELKNILRHLVAFQSVTPQDKGCQSYMMSFLTDLGFTCIELNADPVSNFYAEIGSDGPLLTFAGHTDVVAIGDASQWQHDPFNLTEIGGVLYGRGTADMKGSLAAMMVTAKQFIERHKTINGRLGFIITSGEEGEHFDQGTPYIMEKLKSMGIKPDYCIVGEPSSTHTTGDVIKIGRRGSLTGQLILKGKQGHVAYPHLAENPIHKLSPALAELVAQVWDSGNAFFPPTTLQMTEIQSGGHGGNVIPGDLKLNFNFRFSNEQTEETLKNAVHACLKKHGLTPEIHWRLNGEPFLTQHGPLLEHTIRAVEQHFGQNPELSTSGGTSDGRFIAPYNVDVIELGPSNATIHQVNECVSCHDLEILNRIYLEICTSILH